MLRLTTINSPYDFFPSTFSSIIPQKIKRDIWDFGDKIAIGNKQTNEILSWEAVDRNSFYYKDTIIYIDILSQCDENGYGPCEKISYECLLYDAGNIKLEVRDDVKTLLISIKNPENAEEIYETLNYFLEDSKFSESKYNWIGNEETSNRELYISKKLNDKKKKEIISKIPRIPLTTAAHINKRKRG